MCLQCTEAVHTENMNTDLRNCRSKITEFYHVRRGMKRTMRGTALTELQAVGTNQLFPSTTEHHTWLEHKCANSVKQNYGLWDFPP